MSNLKHQNNGKCLKCAEIFDKFPGFNQNVRGWFTMFQAKHVEAHISCAGRGAADQEAAKLAGKSRAEFGKSAHNWNAAIDLFVLLPQTDLYSKKWFNEVVAPEIPYFLNWYGTPGSSFFELPHIELRDWHGMKIAGDLKLVETPPEGNIA